MQLEDQGPRIYTVSALTEQIKDLLESHFEFLWVEGEISNFRVPGSGHFYMDLKDEGAKIRAVMFRPQSRYLKFMPEDGMKVLAQGRIGVYRPRGEYQLILGYLEPLGIGALALAFEQLKRKLAAQGVFDEKIKKPLPFLPRRVAVITSPTGAAIRDFLKVLRRRFANIEIIVVPVKVQGEEATAEMVEALELVNRELDVDVIVLTRGGGSLEDLWAFNREELALAIRASGVPVVSAVGHEIDVTISDLAADFRAPTPSAAAELLVVEKEALEERLATLRDRIQSAMRSSLANINQRLEFLAKRLRDPRKRLADLWMKLDDVSGRILRRMELILKENRKRLQAEERTLILHSPAQIISAQGERLEFHRKSLLMVAMKKFRDYRAALERFEGKLEDLSPLNVLKRGYSITRKLPQMIILRDVSGVCEGDKVNVRLSEGGLDCVVTKVTK